MITEKASSPQPAIKPCTAGIHRSEEHTSELQSRGLISYAGFCLKKKQRIPWHSPGQAPFRRWGGTQQRARVRHAVRSARRHHAADRLPPSHSQPLFFFNDTATTEIYTLSLHDALPI